MRKQKYLPLILVGGMGVKEIDKEKILESFQWHSSQEITARIKFAQQLLLDGAKRFGGLREPRVARDSVKP